MEQNNVTRNGTLKSTMNPWKMETMTNSCPEQRVIMGRVVSMVVAPPMCVNVVAGGGNRSACRVALQFPTHGTGVSCL